jgi:hypothetical protein
LGIEFLEQALEGTVFFPRDNLAGEYAFETHVDDNDCPHFGFS